MDGHRSRSIPDHVDENLLARALAGQPLADDPTPTKTLWYEDFYLSPKYLLIVP
jgi:hypothetical protein